MPEISPFIISLKLAVFTTTLLFIIGLPAAGLLAYRRFRGQSVIESLIALPIVLPPTVLGFYLLIFLSPNSSIGGFLKENFDLKLVFNFTGMVIASCFYSLPFMIQPLKNGMEKINREWIEAAYTMGKSKMNVLRHIILPNMKPSIITAIITTFAHTLGEFGVVLMIGGNMSEETKVVSIAIYESVENLEFAQAHVYSGVLLVLSFIFLFTVNVVNRHLEAQKND